MPTECSAEKFKFGEAVGRAVVAGFDGGAITSDAGALLLGATDWTIRLTERFAACFSDRRRPELVEYEVGTLVMQRVVGIALGYEDLVDHDQLRHDPALATPGRQARGKAYGLRPARRQTHPEPAGAEPSGSNPIPSDQPRSGRHRGAAR